MISPGNSQRELREKKVLFFAAGAEEVWFCNRDGRMEFYRKEAPETPAGSTLCPEFPQRIQIEQAGRMGEGTNFIFAKTWVSEWRLAPQAALTSRLPDATLPLAEARAGCSPAKGDSSGRSSI